MIKTLSLLNFGKHVERTITFTPGLNILHGVSEAGKTTLFEAMLYVWFGTSALRESLEETVTWGQPDSALKVTVEFDFASLSYSVVRSKSGAVLRCGDRTVTGQKEVRTFMENLFGVTSAMASSLLFADQGAVRGILEEGNTAAGGLVEKLANLNLIEVFVDKIQAQLPAGNTKPILATLDTLKAQLAGEIIEPSAINYEAAVAQLEEIKIRKTAAEAVVAAAVLEVDRLSPAAAKAEELLREARDAETTNTQVRTSAAKLLERANQNPVPPDLDAAAIEVIDAANANAAELRRRYDAYNTKFPAAPSEWEGTVASFDAHLAKLQTQETGLKQKLADLRVSEAGIKGKAIRDNTCAFCMKDLTDVPEVVAINSEIGKDLANLEATRTETADNLAAVAAELLDMVTLRKANEAILKLVNSTYWKVGDTVPAVPEWIGETPEAPAAAVDTKKAKQDLRDYERDLTLQKQALQALSEVTYSKVPDTADALAAKAALVEANSAHLTAQQKLRDVEREVTQVTAAVATAESAYRSEKSRYEALLAGQVQVKESITKLETQLADTEKNNLLIKKLRDAREPITSNLWATTLHAVSHHFTEIRGTPSTITRDAKGFKCNGRPIARLSGSTLDSLGVAIRLALSKLFLPNVPFLFFDEAAAGCSDNRELAMLGTLAASGFTQVLLVTHSDLGDSLSNNFIEV
jgi:DNA repair exonuclease SbcCD ATPase subunit